MKIQSISIRNFIGVHSLSIDVDRPIVCIAGRNGAGKSSVLDAIRYAFTGDLPRVRLKKDRGELVTRGAKSGGVVIATDAGTWTGSLDGAGDRPEPPDALPFVLDAQRFAGLDPKERRTFLSRLMGVTASGDTVRTMLEERGCDLERFEEVRPMLRAGFDAAAAECAKHATGAKGAWRAITGENYGSKKAEGWEPAVPESTPEILRTQRDDLGAALNERREEQGVIRALAGRAENVEKLRAQVARQESLEHERDQATERLKAVEHERDQLLSAGEGSGGILTDLTCTECGTEHRVRIDRGRLTIVPPGTNDPVPDGKIAELRAEESQLRKVVERCTHDLARIAQAQDTLADLENHDSDGQGELDADSIAEDIAHYEEQLRTIDEALRAHQNAAADREAAEREHRAVEAWTALAEALGPSGIPGELLARTLGPVNDRLNGSHQVTGWPQVTVDEDMTIRAGGRRYELLSESEQWRVDAMVADAIAHLSGLRLLALDRMDVLDLGARKECLSWLVASAADYDTVIVMATLKSAPDGFGGGMVRGYWLEGGRIVEQREKAA